MPKIINRVLTSKNQGLPEEKQKNARENIGVSVKGVSVDGNVVRFDTDSGEKTYTGGQVSDVTISDREEYKSVSVAHKDGGRVTVDIYDKAQVDELLANFGGFEKVDGTGEDCHPDVDDPNPRVIYLVEVPGTPEPDHCKEWIWDESKEAWECIGDTSITVEQEYVYIDPVNGDDTNPGWTKDRPVYRLSKAAEIYTSRYPGTKVVAKLLTSPGPDSYMKTGAGVTPNPGNCDNLLTTEIEGITDVYLFGDGAVCISAYDYQESTTSVVYYPRPNYDLHLEMGGSVGCYLSASGTAWNTGLGIKSSHGDIYATGSCDKTMPFMRLRSDEGMVFSAIGPAFNVYSGIDTEFVLDGQIVYVSAPLCGKSLHIISRTLKHQGGPGSGPFGNFVGYGWIKGDVLIESNSSIYLNNYCYCSGKFTIRSLPDAELQNDYNDYQIQPTLQLMSTIYGRGNNDTDYTPGNPSVCTFPDVNIDWKGTVLLAGIHCNNLRVKANIVAMYTSGDVISQNDIYVEADQIKLSNYATNQYWYCLGKMTFMSPKEIKIAHTLLTDELEVVSGGCPANYPISYSDYKHTYWSNSGVTGLSTVACKITNLFECLYGGAEPILSTAEAHYIVRCTGDFADQWSSFINGNAIVTLDVGGHAYLSGNGSMIVKRLCLDSKTAFITNSGIYASSFNMHSGAVMWNNGGNLSQWVNYGSSWNFTSNRSTGVSWSNDFIDQSVFECESLAPHTSSTSGFVHPGYGQSRHDWDINIKVLIPYRGVANYYSGGPEYAAVLGNIFQGSFNGSIAGEIGDVLVTDQKQSPYSHDWIFPYYYHSNYENNKFGNNVTLHLAHRKWHHVYIDMDQGSDAYDGMSKETPVKSIYGLDKAFKQLIYPNYMTIHVCGSSGNGNRGSTSYQGGPYSSLDFSYALNSLEGGLYYNFYAVTYISEHKDALGIPTGWRIPTRADFAALRSASGGYLKLRKPSVMGTDDYGFGDIGQRGGYDADFSYAIEPYFWTSESYNSSYGYYDGIEYSDGHRYKYSLFPVRLVCDNTSGDETGTTGTIEINGDTYSTVVIGSQVWITRNLNYKFDGGTFRDNPDTNRFDTSTTPQYGYFKYGVDRYIPYTIRDNPCYHMPYLLTIVADDPYLSATVRGISNIGSSINMLKMYGFHTLNVVDCFGYVTDLQASVDLRVSEYEARRNNYPRTSVVYLKGGNVTTYGLAAGYDTVIEADNQYCCRSGDSYASFGTSLYPYFYGTTYIHAKYIQFTGNPCTFASGTCATLVAETGFRFGTPCTMEYGSLTVKANGSGNASPQNVDTYPDNSDCTRSYFGIGNWTGVGNVSVICPNQNLYIYTWGQSDRVNGRIHVEANELWSYGNLYGCDIDIHAKRNITIGTYIVGYNDSLVNIDCGGELTGGGIYARCCNMKLNAKKMGCPLNILDGRNTSNNTYLYVNTDYAANGVIKFDNPTNTNIRIFSRIVELAGPFYIYEGTTPLSNNGEYFKQFKGLITYYTGSDAEHDLADFKEIAPNADFELSVLSKTKQIAAGSGISITESGNQLIITSTGGGGSADIPVVDSEILVEDTTGVFEINPGEYSRLVGLTNDIDTIEIVMANGDDDELLQEASFEFVTPAEIELTSLTMIKDGRILPSIQPSEYHELKQYQGTIVNGIGVIAEFEPVIISITSIKRGTDTGESIDLNVIGDNITDMLEYELALDFDGTITVIDITGKSVTLTGNLYTAYIAAEVATASAVLDGHTIGPFNIKGTPPVVIDGRSYDTVQIGSRIWMAENLASDTAGGVWYNNDSTYDNLGYGKLYTLNEVMAINVPGWHVMAINEATELTAYANFDYSDTTTYNEETALMLMSQTGWNDGGGTNDLEFNAVGAGFYGNGAFEGSGLGTWWPCYVEAVGGYYSLQILTGSMTPTGNPGVMMVPAPEASADYRYSVRLVKDFEYQDGTPDEPVTINGITYNTIKIGDDIWLAENLSDDTFGGRWYQDSQSSYSAYGKLYSPDEVAAINVPGWHVPTYAELNTLVAYADFNFMRLKSSNTWDDGYPGDSNFGFNALAGGYLTQYPNGGTSYFDGLGQVAAFYATIDKPGKIFYFSLSGQSATGQIIDSTNVLAMYTSVRLVKDR